MISPGDACFGFNASNSKTLCKPRDAPSWDLAVTRSQVRCGSMMMLIMTDFSRSGGFKRLDSVIFTFRLQAFQEPLGRVSLGVETDGFKV